MSKKLFRNIELLGFNSKSSTPVKASPSIDMGVTVSGTANSLTRGIVQWSQEGFGYMTLEGDE